MTGGAGFSGTGENSIKQNRALVGSRTLMKDHPYAPSNHVKKIPALKNYEQIKQWRLNSEEIRNRKQWRIAIALLFLLILSILIFMILGEPFQLFGSLT